MTTPAKRILQLPGAAYRLQAHDAAGQFAELLAVLKLSDIVDAGGSRCGICNGDDWYTLRPEQVEPGQVPPAVLRKQNVFYRCGKCQQIFWPGDKYENTMEGLRAEGKEGDVASATDESAAAGSVAPSLEPPRAGTAGGIWRPRVAPCVTCQCALERVRAPALPPPSAASCAKWGRCTRRSVWLRRARVMTVTPKNGGDGYWKVTPVESSHR